MTKADVTASGEPPTYGKSWNSVSWNLTDSCFRATEYNRLIYLFKVFVKCKRFMFNIGDLYLRAFFK